MTKKLKPIKYLTEGLIENQCERGGKVLKNKLGIRKKREMDEMEGVAFQKAQIHFYKLFSEDPSPSITENVIRKMHHHWLKKIYAWAGSKYPPAEPGALSRQRRDWPLKGA